MFVLGNLLIPIFSAMLILILIVPLFYGFGRFEPYFHRIQKPETRRFLPVRIHYKSIDGRTESEEKLAGEILDKEQKFRGPGSNFHLAKKTIRRKRLKITK